MEGKIMDYNQEIAVYAYKQRTGRDFSPGELVEVPLDALVFAEYQFPWVDLESYKRDRCNYDYETNDELIHLVTVTLLQPDIPPIYLDILPDGVALVDGAHRSTAAFIAGHSTIFAYLNKE